MNFIFDQNISFRILKKLPVFFVNSTHILSENLIDANDEVIWSYAKTNNLIIITQDADFNDIYTVKGFPPKIIWIRAGNLSTNQIIEILEKSEDEIKAFIESEKLGCLEITRFF